MSQRDGVLWYGLVILVGIAHGLFCLMRRNRRRP